MLSLTRNQILVFILVVVLVLTTTCKEYFGNTNCNDIRGNQPENCQVMSLTECQEWANNMGKDFEPNNDVFCGVVDTCPIGCYVHSGTVYYGQSTNIGECNNKRVCVQNNI